MKALGLYVRRFAFGREVCLRWEPLPLQCLGPSGPPHLATCLMNVHNPLASLLWPAPPKASMSLRVALFWLLGVR